MFHPSGVNYRLAALFSPYSILKALEGFHPRMVLLHRSLSGTEFLCDSLSSSTFVSSLGNTLSVKRMSMVYVSADSP